MELNPELQFRRQSFTSLILPGKGSSIQPGKGLKRHCKRVKKTLQKCLYVARIIAYYRLVLDCRHAISQVM